MIATLTIIYILSVYFAWKWTHIAHYADDGRWNGIEPDIIEFIIIFIPFYNIVWFCDNPRRNYIKKSWVSNFFGNKSEKPQ